MVWFFRPFRGPLLAVSTPIFVSKGLLLQHFTNPTKISVHHSRFVFEFSRLLLLVNKFQRNFVKSQTGKQTYLQYFFIFKIIFSDFWKNFTISEILMRVILQTHFAYNFDNLWIQISQKFAAIVRKIGQKIDTIYLFANDNTSCAAGRKAGFVHHGGFFSFIFRWALSPSHRWRLPVTRTLENYYFSEWRAIFWNPVGQNRREQRRLWPEILTSAKYTKEWLRKVAYHWFCWILPGCMYLCRPGVG